MSKLDDRRNEFLKTFMSSFVRSGAALGWDEAVKELSTTKQCETCSKKPKSDNSKELQRDVSTTELAAEIKKAERRGE